MQPERRRSERVDVFLIVEFRPFGRKVEYTQGVTENISDIGFSCDSQNHHLDPGAFLDIKLKHPQEEFSVSVSGEILWKRESWYKCVTGIKYRDLDRDTERSLSELVSAARSKDAGPSTPQSEEVGIEKESLDIKSESVQEAELDGEKTEDEIQDDSERTGTNEVCSAEGPSAVDSGTDRSIGNAAIKAEPYADNSNSDDKQLKDSSLKAVLENKQVLNKKGHRRAAPKTAETRKNRKPFYITFAVFFLIVIAVILYGKFERLNDFLGLTPVILVEDVDENDFLAQYEDASSGSMTREEPTGPVPEDGMLDENIVPDEGGLNPVEQLPSEIVTEQEIAEDIGSGMVSDSVDQQMPAVEKENNEDELLEGEKTQVVVKPSYSQNTGNKKLSGVKNEDRFYSSSISESSLPVASFETHISFARNSDVVNPAFDSEIDKVAVLLINNPAAAAVLEGYTDNVGPAVYNIDLSIRRANAVRALLVLRGVDSSRIETAGIGDSNPVFSNKTPTGRSLNRRVEIRINYSGD